MATQVVTGGGSRAGVARANHSLSPEALCALGARASGDKLLRAARYGTACWIAWTTGNNVARQYLWEAWTAG